MAIVLDDEDDAGVGDIDKAIAMEGALAPDAPPTPLPPAPAAPPFGAVEPLAIVVPLAPAVFVADIGEAVLDAPVHGGAVAVGMHRHVHLDSFDWGRHKRFR